MSRFDEEPDGDLHGECAAEIRALCHEITYEKELLAWAYGKLHNRTFSKMDDDFMLDRVKLYLEHGVAA